MDPNALPEGPSPLIFVVQPPLLRLPARYASMQDLASVFQRAVLERPVVDQTGLTGRYDFDLEFAIDETLFGGALGKGSEDAKESLGCSRRFRNNSGSSCKPRADRCPYW